MINPTASTSASETAAAYPTAAPSHASDLPEIICNISCSVEESASTASYGETGVYKRSLGSASETKCDSPHAHPTAVMSHLSDLPESSSSISCSEESISTSSFGETGVLDTESASDESPSVTRPSVLQGGLDAHVLPDGYLADDGDCGRRVRPIAPQTPWGWPSRWKSGHRAPYMCHYHAATLPECKNIHDQAVASYCVKSPRPGLCKARACQVLDQCKSIIASGRGYCWNPRWFV